jgi:hypothetical protein
LPCRLASRALAQGLPAMLDQTASRAPHATSGVRGGHVDGAFDTSNTKKGASGGRGALETPVPRGEQGGAMDIIGGDNR